jgi:tetratricopeptide (TPR) repeat protein
VQNVTSVLPLGMVRAMGDSGWALTQQYAALVRFGLWDELIALTAPDPGAQGLSAGYLYGRGVALAARGRIKDAKAVLTELHELGAAAPADALAGFNSLRGIIGVAEPLVVARIAASERRDADAVASLRQAVAAEDKLAYDEPADWFFPVRHLLGAELLLSGQPAEAEQVYREDLKRNPQNGWSLYGLSLALKAQGKTLAAARFAREYAAAWRHADIRLPGSAFWFAGPDTQSCECQRVAAAQPGARLD